MGDLNLLFYSEFTEQFSKERLASVFGINRVYSNIKIRESKNLDLGEIDVLAIFGNRAIILQAKSKKLTIEARKGNDKILKTDFKKSIQDSYDQALLCSKLIIDEKNKLFDDNDNILEINRDFKEIYIFCVVSDHYPALFLQTKSFLIYEKSNIIMPPFVMDIFMLDVLAEIINSPIQFLSYINRRALFYENILANNELTILGYHLTQNLWINDKTTNLYLESDFGTDIDIAMGVRRRGLPGKDISNEIQVKMKNSTIGKLLNNIEQSENSMFIDLSFFLLQLNEDSRVKISKCIDKIADCAKRDGNQHDCSLLFGYKKTGITIHCNNLFIDNAKDKLQKHCEIKKYSQKAKYWFGICLDPYSNKLRFVTYLNYEWAWSRSMDDETKDLLKKNNMVHKVGRNDLCPCGSGLKYKKCCI